MPELRAMHGRVILKFPAPVEETVSGIVIPVTSAQRPEFGLIHDIGEPLTEDERKIARKLRELQFYGTRIAVSFASGTSYWQPNYDPKVYGWIKDFRAYRISEIAAYLVEATEAIEGHPA